MDSISGFVARSTILLHLLVILRSHSQLVAAQDTPPIVFTDRLSIHQINLDGSSLRNIYRPSSGFVDLRGLDFDFRRGIIYWSDLAGNTIWQSRLDGSNVRVFLNSSIREPEDIAWDWVNQKMYWINRLNRTINVYDPVRNINKTIIDAVSGAQLRSVSVDPSTGYLYWTDFSPDSARIVKTSMDGTSSTVLADSSLVAWPNALAIDYDNQILYWADAKYDYVGRMDTSGSNVVKLVADLKQALAIENSHPYSMSYYDGHLYWTEWLNDGSILKMNVTTGSNYSIAVLISGVGGGQIGTPTGIKVFDASQQPMFANPCGDDNGGCSHLCLPSPSSSSRFTCACPDDVQLSEDGKNCGDQPVTTTAAADEVLVTISPLVGPCNMSNPCLNGARCQNLGTGPTQYFCVCLENYSGRNCQISPALPEQSGGDGDSSSILIGTVLVFGSIVVVVVVALLLIIVIFVFYKLKSGKAKERSQSFSALSTTSSRDSPTHIVVFRNGRGQSEHDYASIKSRDSPAPKGGLLIYTGTGNHYVYPQPAENAPRQSFHRILASNGTLDGYLCSSMEKSDSSTKDSDTEPFYSNVKSKTNTL